MRLSLAVLLGLAVLGLAGPVAWADVLHSSTFSGALVEMETADATAHLIGSDGTSTRAAAFDVDGTLYTTVNSGRSLGTYDLATGAVTVVGSMFSSEAMDAIEIDATGQLHGVTLAGRLYRIDKSNGTPTYLANVGIRNIQDVAYDPDGNLWAVAGNTLYLIDIETGTAQLVGRIGGALVGNVFGIAFDGAGALWATSTTPNAPLYEIDLDTLAVRLVGTTGVDYPRGCDIYVAAPTRRELPPPDGDGDGVPDHLDAVPDSDLRATVWVGEMDTGAENVLFESGATIADLLAACASDADRRGVYVRRVAHLCGELRRDGWITGREHGAIQRAAARLLR